MWDDEQEDIYWVDSSDDTWLWADPELLQYQFSALPPGLQVFIEIEVLDFGGNSDWVEVSTLSP